MGREQPERDGHAGGPRRRDRHDRAGGTPRALAFPRRVWVGLSDVARTAPAGGGLRAGARVKALGSPPCGPVVTGAKGDPDLLIASDLPLAGQQRSRNRWRPRSPTCCRTALSPAGSRSGCNRATRRRAIRLLDPAKCKAKGCLRGQSGGHRRRRAVQLGLRRADAAGAQPAGVALVSPTNSAPYLVDHPPPDLFPRAGTATCASGRPTTTRPRRARSPSSASGTASSSSRTPSSAPATPCGGGSRTVRACSASRSPGGHLQRQGARLSAPRRPRPHSKRPDVVYLNTNARPISGGCCATACGPRPERRVVTDSDMLPAAADLQQHRPGHPWAARDLGGAASRSRRPGVREAFAATQANGHVANVALHAAAAAEVLLDAIAHSDGTRADNRPPAHRPGSRSVGRAARLHAHRRARGQPGHARPRRDGDGDPEDSAGSRARRSRRPDRPEAADAIAQGLATRALWVSMRTAPLLAFIALMFPPSLRPTRRRPAPSGPRRTSPRAMAPSCTPTSCARRTCR